jgi:hypothetical protein
MRAVSGKEWQDLFRSFLQMQPPSSFDRCPDPEELSRFFGPEIPRKKKFELLNHICECRSCREEFEWLHELDLRAAELEKGIDGITKIRRNGRNTRTWLWAGLSATAVIGALFLFVPGQRIPANRQPAYRENKPIQFQDIFPAHGAGVARAMLYFRWKPPLPGGSFVFELFDPAMALIWRGPATSEPEIHPPANIVRSLREGEMYFWSVSGSWADRPIIESALFNFRIKR